jgi:hypothetical protein
MDNATKRIVDEAARVFKDTLREKLEGVSAKDMTPERFSNLEAVIQDVLGDVGCLIEKEFLEGCDIDVPHVDRDGRRYYRKFRHEEEYQTFFGKVRVERTVYQANGDNRAICPMEERAGVIHHNSTPLAAELMAYCSALMVPGKVEDFCIRFHMMKPCSTVVKNVAGEVGESFEESWDAIAEESREQLKEGREEAKVVALARDGVMLQVRGEGWREAMVGTVRYYRTRKESIEASYVAQMPEYGRAQFERKLEGEIQEALRSIRSGAKAVCLGDGAVSNWDFFDSIPELARAPRCLDFMHACGHMKDAAKAVFKGDKEAQNTWFKKYRKILKRDRRGAERAIRSMRYHLSKIPERQKKRRHEVTKVIGYFTKNLDRMKYRSLRDRGLPIGSGIVESACKTVVQARLKQSGMRWSIPGGQGIMNLRTSVLSDERWDIAWGMHLRKNVRVAA